jgi:hypothetical protein
MLSFPRLLALAGLSAWSVAQAAVLDFNHIVLPGTTSPVLALTGPVLEDGFRLSTRGGVSFTFSGGQIYATTPANANWTGSPGVFSGVGSAAYGSAFRLEKIDGGSFSLQSLDAAAFSTAAAGRNFAVYGVTTSNQVFSKQVTLDTSTNTLETITFDSRFQGLSYVIFSAVYAQVDNINLSYAGEPVVSGVPEADSLALALVGLGVVGGVVRSRRAGRQPGPLMGFAAACGVAKMVTRS